MSKIDKIFVYGTLKEESKLKEKWSVEPQKVEVAEVKGKLYKVSWYPMLMDNDPENEYAIPGKLMTIPELEDDPGLFDEYEGCDGPVPIYHRKLKEVKRSNGEKVKAWVYVGNPDCDVAKEHCVEENLIEGWR